MNREEVVVLQDTTSQPQQSKSGNMAVFVPQVCLLKAALGHSSLLPFTSTPRDPRVLSSMYLCFIHY